MTRVERDKICVSCVQHKKDDRYGIICGLTDNYANFQDTCKDYLKKPTTIKPPNTKTETKITKRKKKSFGSVIGSGVAIYIIFKIVLAIIKALNR